MTIKENAAQNVPPALYTAGSFHVILDMCISALNAMEYFTNKTTFYEIALETMLCHQVFSSIWSFI